MSQPLFARLLGVDKSAVAQCEQGSKQPSGPAERLLEVLGQERGEESPTVRMPCAMAPGACGAVQSPTSTFMRLQSGAHRSALTFLFEPQRLVLGLRGVRAG